VKEGSDKVVGHVQEEKSDVMVKSNVQIVSNEDKAIVCTENYSSSEVSSFGLVEGLPRIQTALILLMVLRRT
jgi:hypothetical protein